MPPSSHANQSNAAQHSAYRADIDGLRALAIVPVVLYHAFPGSLPGGFVGVDIFFVISGYLISTIIFRELRQQRFSFSRFYSRRALRLFPALSLVLIVCLVFGWLALDPDEFKMLGKHVAAGAGFIQNFVLWGEVGYFDVSSESKPLLHLWSLAVEEQYYLMFPLLVWLAWRVRLNLLGLVIAIASASLAANLYWVSSDPAAAFYLPHTRVWELMAGAILAAAGFYVQQPPLSSVSNLAKGKSAISWLGLTLILIALFALDKYQEFPGWRALLPVVGAALIIYAGQSAWLNQKLLANRLLVLIGLISYPLYLWHWPLLAFANIIESEPLSVVYRLSIVTLSVLLASLTYLLVEKPIRLGNFQRTWTIVLSLVMLCLGVLGYLAYERELTSRVGASVQEIKRWEQQHPSFEQNCTASFAKWNDRNDSFKCIFLQDRAPEIVVIGDSHARRLHYGISHYLGDDYNIALFPSGCAMPFYDLSVGIRAKYRTPGYSYFRAKLINAALDFAISEPKVELIVLNTSACWENIVDIKDLDETNAQIIVERKMRLTFDKLTASGKPVLYVLSNPALDFDPKSCVTRPFRISSADTRCKMDRAVFDNWRVEYYDIASRVLADYPNIKVFNAADKLCDEQFCYSVINKQLMYHDGSHLNYQGSEYIAQFLLPLIEDSLSSEP